MRRLEESLARLGRPARFEYYAGARHGFAVRTHPGFHAATAEASFIEARRFIATLNHRP